MSDETRLYYEAHITLTPLSDADQSILSASLVAYLPEWHQASFSMETAEHRASAFLTCRSQSRNTISTLTRVAIARLAIVGLTVTRYKIEETILDSRMGDRL